MQQYEQAGALGAQTLPDSIGAVYTPVQGGRTASKGAIYPAIKRILDFLAALVGLVILLPVFLVIMAAVKLDSKGPVFYRHRRTGRHGEDLYLYKFRSMVCNAQEVFDQFPEHLKKEFYKEYKLDNDPRITRIGGFLRKTSLDELPQLLNILQGKLSFIGPRPVVEDEAERYGALKTRFLSVTPGLSGYWQVNGRSLTTYEERMDMELYYVHHASFVLDLQILLKTARAVFRCIGAK